VPLLGPEGPALYLRHSVNLLLADLLSVLCGWVLLPRSNPLTNHCKCGGASTPVARVVTMDECKRRTSSKPRPRPADPLQEPRKGTVVQHLDVLGSYACCTTAVCS
jgi:hypothetical protein